MILSIPFSSAAFFLLLSKAGILRELCAITILEITNEVKKEVLMGLEKGRKDAIYVKELEKENKVKIMKVNKSLTEKFTKDFNMGRGEASTIALALKKRVAILTDDNKARKVAKAMGLTVLSSLQLPLILYKKEVIPYNKAKLCLDILKKEGWFSEYLLFWSYNELENLRNKI